MAVKPLPPRKVEQVKAMTPERDACEIRFPRVAGYRVELPEDRLRAEFNADSMLELTPNLIGPSRTRNEGIIGEGVDLNLVHTNDLRRSTLLFHLTQRAAHTPSGATPEKSRNSIYSVNSSELRASGWMSISFARAALTPLN